MPSSAADKAAPVHSAAPARSGVALAGLRADVHATLLAALAAVGAYVYLPLGPVPVVLTNLFVLLAGLLLGPRGGATAMGLYLLAGAAGFPVFAGGRGGLVFLLGPTGGYLFGFLPAAALAGWVAQRGRGRVAADVAAALLGAACIYAVGLPWLKLSAGLSWSSTLTLGLLPFIAGDLLKAALAVVVVRRLRRLSLPGSTTAEAPR